MPADPLGRFAVAFAITVAFAVAARMLRAVTTSGTLAGGAVALLLLLGWGWKSFAVLGLVFVLTWAATRAGYDRKQAIKVAERSGGRDASQVLANIGMAGLAAGLTMLFPAYDLYLKVAAYAVMAEAAADTVSSEIGEAFGGSPRLLISWKIVPPGSDGAITALGTLAGAAAAVAIGLAAMRLIHNLPADALWIVPLSGIAGMMVDSILGAVLERRGLLGNNEVNLISTATAALLAILLAAL